MLSTLTVKIPEATKAEIETLTQELGLWESQSDFVREALDQHISKYWKGERFEH